MILNYFNLKNSDVLVDEEMRINVDVILKVFLSPNSFQSSSHTPSLSVMSSLRNGVKQVRVERPRPLKMGGGTQPELGLGDLVTVLESVTRSLAGSGKPVMAGAGDPGVIRQLETLAANLRMTGPQLELSHKVIFDSDQARI